MPLPANLILQNHHVFKGVLFGATKTSRQSTAAAGEVVFSTGMTGYVESLTDPSYTGQILVFTYPLMGNYGVPDKSTWESGKIQPAGVVVSQLAGQYSHSSALHSLGEWLKSQDIPLLTGVDTRALTQELRNHGTMMGAVTPNTKVPPLLPLPGDLVSRVSPTKTIIYNGPASPKPQQGGGGSKKIILVDCGMKENILRSLKAFGLTIKRVPYTYDYTGENWDGVFISNGPGDPAALTTTIGILKKALTKNKPVFGICLGSQLLALAAGAKTYKLPFGHRGHNQPCIEVATGRGYITSQNHGYAVDAGSVPAGWAVSFRNGNDGSVEGIAHTKLPFFSVQFHPEACPGPTDTAWLFEKFYNLL